MDPLESDDADVASAIDAAFDAELAPVPAALRDRALDAFRFRPADPVADLVTDSASEEVLTIRGVAPPRVLVFAHEEVRVHVLVRGGGVTVRIEPVGAHRCRVERIGSISEHTVGDDGQITIGAVSLPIRVRVEHEDSAFVTPWIVG